MCCWTRQPIPRPRAPACPATTAHPASTAPAVVCPCVCGVPVSRVSVLPSLASTPSGINLSVGANLDVLFTIGGTGGSLNTSIMAIASSLDSTTVQVPPATSMLASLQAGPVAAITAALASVRGASKTSATVAKNAGNIANLTLVFSADASNISAQASSVINHASALSNASQTAAGNYFGASNHAALAASQSTTMSQQLAAEITQATSADSTLSLAAASEASRAVAVEAGITGSVSNVTAAYNARVGQNTTLASVAASLSAAIPVNTSIAVAAETARATGVEAAVSTMASAVVVNIALEASRAAIAESYISSNITTYYYNATAINSILAAQLQLVQSWISCEGGGCGCVTYEHACDAIVLQTESTSSIQPPGPACAGTCTSGSWQTTPRRWPRVRPAPPPRL